MSEKIISVKTKYGVYNVPNTIWPELEKYWVDIIVSIIEVLKENKFNISEVRKNNPTGFIASTYYWKAHKRNSQKYPLMESKKFISLLKEKARFNQALTKFNQGKNTNWLLKSKTSTLGGFLCSFCNPLLEFLKSL